MATENIRMGKENDAGYKSNQTVTNDIEIRKKWTG